MARGRSLADRIGDSIFGAPPSTPAERARLAEIRASVRLAANDAERLYLGELDRAGAARGVMAPPPVRKRQAYGAFRGEYLREGAGGYDWFDSLSAKEQDRLTQGGWFAERGRGEAPDEVAERIPIRQWLQLTRNADMTRAMATGRGVDPDRFGGQDPADLIAGSPYDFPELYDDDEDRAARHVRRAVEEGRTGQRGTGCQFRTAKDGHVYPLSGTCTNPRAPAVGYLVNSQGQQYADEAF